MDDIIIEVSDDYEYRYDFDEVTDKDDNKKLQFKQLNNGEIEITPNGKCIVAYIKEENAIAWWTKKGQDATDDEDEKGDDKDEGPDMKGGGGKKKGEDMKLGIYTQGQYVKVERGKISSICASDLMIAYIHSNSEISEISKYIIVVLF